MTDTFIRMTYLGDGISTDDEGVEGEEIKEEGGDYSPLPTEEEGEGDFSGESEEDE